MSDCFADSLSIPIRCTNTDSPTHPHCLFYLITHSLTHTDNPCPRLGPLSTGWRLKNIFSSDDFLPHKPMFTTKTDDFQGTALFCSRGYSTAYPPPRPANNSSLHLLLVPGIIEGISQVAIDSVVSGPSPLTLTLSMLPQVGLTTFG